MKGFIYRVEKGKTILSVKKVAKCITQRRENNVKWPEATRSLERTLSDLILKDKYKCKHKIYKYKYEKYKYKVAGIKKKI